MSARTETARRSLVAIASLACALSLVACGRAATTYSGTVQAEAPNIGSTVGGRVSAVLVTTGQHVTKGQIILTLDPKDQRAALAQAQGQLAQARSTLADLQAGPRPQDIAKANAEAEQARHVYDQARITGPHQIAQAQATVRQASAAASVASADEVRARELYAKGYTSTQARDDAVSTNRQAQAQLRSAQAQLAAAESGSVPQGVAAAQQAYQSALANAQLVAAGTRPDQIAQAKAAVETAQAGVRAAQARLVEMTVRAPEEGIVNGLSLRVGDLVPAGAAVATIDEFKDPYLYIYVPQSNLGKVQVGQAVTVRSDAYPGRTFDAHVEAVDQTAQFTPRDVQTAEDRANIVFGVKVRVHDPNHELRGGTTADVAL
ncbi:MAG: HlyD family efflux transporter periplasmic adaptor subunit [Candidatus Eremiobacteraeota bacterium]|nr:HlyD family efflux transporter periplasmic adaptor subunit [Candidatus Eremiobacteraeota bacterium]MBV8367199.1 HlyD family efflux transporter periplasmic adaptor subunit [Candidatus Eremiobacteraeota bacterium]